MPTDGARVNIQNFVFPPEMSTFFPPKKLNGFARRTTTRRGNERERGDLWLKSKIHYEDRGHHFGAMADSTRITSTSAFKDMALPYLFHSLAPPKT